jgi:hypothetical protein
MAADRHDVIATLQRAHRPSGRRLGIAVVPGVAQDLADAAARALVATGADPARRLAWLRPRPGEHRTRPEDVAYFMQRFGHEYTVLLCPQEHAAPDANLEEVCHQVGCSLIVA